MNLKYFILLSLLLFSGCESTMKKMDIKTPEENFKIKTDEQNKRFEETLKNLKNNNNSEYYKNSEEYK
jgi:hypothetical protein